MRIVTPYHGRLVLARLATPRPRLARAERLARLVGGRRRAQGSRTGRWVIGRGFTKPAAEEADEVTSKAVEIA